MARIPLANKVAANNLSARLHRIAKIFEEISQNYACDGDLDTILARGQFLAIDAIADIEKVAGFPVYRNIAPSRGRPRLIEVRL